MFKDFKVEILGAKYSVYFVDEFPERLSEFRENSIGLCNRYDREIFIRKCKDKDVSEKGRERCEKDTLRHELLHAYFAECGLSANTANHFGAWAENEEMVDWFAIQSPKIFETFKEVGCL